ncbi:MAG TPA: DUF6424 family protein [Nitrospiraceae bacterium]|nr:DUF6424 family protein [Nitrospiraceae bacterium]
MAKQKKATTGKAKRSVTTKKGGVKGGTSAKGLHTEHEDFPWTINIPDHTPRKDSDAYKVARKIMNTIAPSKNWYLGQTPYQDHHGGGLWMKDENGWFMVKNLAGMEWSSQFCADPRKVDFLRQNAKRLYAKFPLSTQAFKRMGFDLDALLNRPITNAEGVSAWTDSICNASVPLPQPAHTGIVPHGGGVHHYPTPITDITLFKYDDFELWVTDQEGKPTAVVPVDHRGSGNGKVEVVYATPGTKLHKQLHRAQIRKKRLIADEGQRLAKRAFAKQ